MKLGTIVEYLDTNPFLIEKYSYAVTRIRNGVTHT